MPEPGQNAIENMLKLLLRVTEYISSKAHGLVYNSQVVQAARLYLNFILAL